MNSLRGNRFFMDANSPCSNADRCARSGSLAANSRRRRPEFLELPTERRESVVDVLCREFHRLTKFSYSSGGKSLRNIENNARPNEERVNGLCGIDCETFVRLFKSSPLLLIQPSHIRT